MVRFGPWLGVEGVAIATLIAEWTGLALGVWLCRDGFADGIWRDWARVFDAARLRRMLQVNGDIMLRSVLLTGSFTTFLFVGSDLGDVNLAANQVLLQFLEITAFALDGFAFSAEALVGGAVGARDRYQVRRASVMASQWGVGALLLAAVFFVAGPALIDLMSTSPQVREAGREYLFWAAIAPVIGVASWMFDGIYIGATDPRHAKRDDSVGGDLCGRFVHAGACLRQSRPVGRADGSQYRTWCDNGLALSQA